MSIRIGIVSTYPPTHCGIASFSQSLASAIKDLKNHQVSIVRLTDSESDQFGEFKASDVAATLKSGSPNSLENGIAALNKFDIAVIQHEFGIYGGSEGDEVLEIMRRLQIPSLVVIHTVLANPTWYQRYVFTEMIRMASAVVVMSRTSRELLLSKYHVDESKLFMIPHGAPEFPLVNHQEISRRPLVLTWGLLGPGKGIEWAIEAFAALRDLDPAPRYLVAGQTHPKVAERRGEAYRHELEDLIFESGLSDVVSLSAEYMCPSELGRLVASASAVLLPYESTSQMISGVLVEAIAAGRPVIATGFPHAVELLADGVGVVVPHQDPRAISLALRSVLQDPVKTAFMSKRAMELGRGFLWTSVAKGYVKLAEEVIRAEVAA